MHRERTDSPGELGESSDYPDGFPGVSGNSFAALPRSRRQAPTRLQDRTAMWVSVFLLLAAVAVIALVVLL